MHTDRVTVVYQRLPVVFNLTKKLDLIKTTKYRMKHPKKSFIKRIHHKGIINRFFMRHQEMTSTDRHKYYVCVLTCFSLLKKEMITQIVSMSTYVFFGDSALLPVLRLATPFCT